MANPATEAVTTTVEPTSGYVEWAPILAGAVAAAAMSTLLLTFGGAVGLSVSSPWPNSGVSLATVAVLAGLWAVVVQVGCFAIGGYFAGRMRSRWDYSGNGEAQFRDGAHGFMVWATGVLFGALILGITGTSTLLTAAQSGATVAAVASDDAPSPVNYAVDFLLRPAPASADAPINLTGVEPRSTENTQALRSELGRIFTSTVADEEVSRGDYDYLVQVVSRRTNMSDEDAAKRVDAAFAELQKLEVSAREAADKARRSGLLLGFLAAASLLISAAAAVAGATLGGRHRDEGTPAHFMGRPLW